MNKYIVAEARGHYPWCVQQEYFDEMDNALDFVNKYPEFKIQRVIETENEYKLSDFNDFSLDNLFVIQFKANGHLKNIGYANEVKFKGYLVRASFANAAIEKARELYRQNRRDDKAKRKALALSEAQMDVIVMPEYELASV
jgi:hypothetical protein